MDWEALWKNIDAFFAFPPFKALTYIVLAILLRIVLQFVISRVVNRIVSGVKRKQQVDDTMALFASPLTAVRTVQRTRALGTVLSSAVTTTIIIVTAILLITTVSAEASSAFALITAALGAGLGFGAQNIVKDVLNGIFMVVEDQLGVGDVVDLGTATGVVEAVGIRVTQVRDVNGTLWFVRNGEILRVGNMSQGWSRVIIDLAVPYDSDIDAVQEKILATAKTLASDSKWRSRIIEKPEIWGIESISSEAIVVRLVIKTSPANKDDVARELRARLKRALDEMGVRLPALNSIVLSGFEGAASVKGARPPKTAQIPVTPASTPTKRGRKDPRAIPRLPKDTE